jgi:hypothetical protein
MNLDSYLAEMLDEYIEIFFDDAYLNQLWATWSMEKDDTGLTPFADFIYGNLNGSITTLYSSYHGKRVMELDEAEFEELRKLLNTRYSGVEKKVKQFQEKIQNNQV